MNLKISQIAAVGIGFIVSIIFFGALQAFSFNFTQGMPPTLLKEFRGTTELSGSESEAKAIDLNVLEIQTLNSIAGSILGLLFLNFIFSAKLSIRNLALFTATVALFLSCICLIHGFFALNELKWIVMSEQGFEAWFQTRLFGFQLAQKIAAGIAFLTFGLFAFLVVMSKRIAE